MKLKEGEKSWKNVPLEEKKKQKSSRASSEGREEQPTKTVKESRGVSFMGFFHKMTADPGILSEVSGSTQNLFILKVAFYGQRSC